MKPWIITAVSLVAAIGCGADTTKSEQTDGPGSPGPASTAMAQQSPPVQAGPAGAASTASTPQPAAPTPVSASGTSGAPGTSGAAMADPQAASPRVPSGPIGLMVDPEREHIYDDASKWLCLPGMADELCTTGLDATIVRADGSTELEPHVVAKEPAFDCFYVYPTVSNDSGANSDFNAGSEETNVVKAQAGRYSRVCRVFAPLYRQVTLTALTGMSINDQSRTMAYDDVVAAFNRYLTMYNAGRGFVLIGHSQGSGMLRRLIASEIDERPELRGLLIAAHLLGTAVAVPAGQDVGGDFKNVPICRSDTQSGCVVVYSTFRDRSPPPDNSRFGKVANGRAACANPAALGGGKGILTPYFGSSQAAFAQGGARITTPFITFPDFLQSECVDRGDFTYLELTVLSDPADPRVDDISGDLSADWGLHLVDVSIAMGTLVELAAKQANAFAARP